MSSSILITGAGRGLGFALADIFYQKGWQVFPLVRSKSGALSLKKKLGARCVPIVGDVRDLKIEQTIAKALLENTSTLDVLVNNAGIPGKGFHIQDVSTVELLNLFDVHCVGAVRCVQACLPFLQQSKQPVIVNITSRLGSITKTSNGDFTGEEHSYAYRIAKAAQNMLSACLATDGHLTATHVLSVHPGRMKTSLGDDLSPRSPDESAKALFRLVTRRKVPKSGFFDIYNGTISW
jgi:NAD(P)-dependent dehydrogenase (short-subunit alcohol dehydrogenase family)